VAYTGINAAAKTYRVSARTLRFYEEAGLLTSHRKNASYREYDEAQMHRLGLIVLLRRLSFSVKDIEGLLLADGADFRAALANRLRENERQLIVLRETDGLLRTLSAELAHNPAELLRADTLLNALVYLTNHTERMIPMKAPHEEPNRIALGQGIATELVSEQGGDLLRQIKQFRAESEARPHALPPVIRVYDSADLPRCQVLAVWGGREILRRDYAPEDCTTATEDILTRIREVSGL